MLPLRTLLVEQPADETEPTGYWMTNLRATTPVADLVRWAKMRRRIEHDYRELKHGHKSPDAGLTLYQVLDPLQDLLRCWTGICTTCGRPLTTSRTRART